MDCREATHLCALKTRDSAILSYIKLQCGKEEGRGVSGVGVGGCHGSHNGNDVVRFDPSVRSVCLDVFSRVRLLQLVSLCHRPVGDPVLSTARDKRSKSAWMAAMMLTPK